MHDASTELSSPAIISTAATPSGRRINGRRTVVVMVLAALAIRLLTMLFTYPDRLDPRRGHWDFAWEMGMVARSVITGKGFSSPFVGETGPTAWFPPVYPYLLASIFKVFGLFSRAAAVTALSINCIFSTLTCVPIFFIARRTIGERVARLAGWIWVFFPYSIWVASVRIWENALTTLLLSLLVWLTLALDDEGRTSHWMGYGLLCGIAALTNPNVLAVFPFLLAWIAWRRYRDGKPWFVKSVLVLFTIVAVLAPWTIRNYRVFHRLMPLRSNFWVEARVGNTGDVSAVYAEWAHPAQSSAQWNELHRVGEVGYMVEMRKLALRFIRDYPGSFAWLTAKRFLLTWTGFWSLDPKYARGEPFQLPNTFFCTSLTVLALAGLVRVWRLRREWILPYAAVLGAYPAVYYITHVSVDYRHPIDPMLVILIACAVLSFRDRRRTVSAA